MQLFPSYRFPAILLKENQLRKNKPEPTDSRRSYRTCQSREHRAARLAAPPQPGAPQLPLLNLFPTAPSSVRLSISTLACFSLQHLTLSSFLEDLVPVDSALPNQPTQQKSLKQSLIFYHILLTPSITSSFPEALSQ